MPYLLMLFQIMKFVWCEKCTTQTIFFGGGGSLNILAVIVSTLC